jgi:hypothetical protein
VLLTVLFYRGRSWCTLTSASAGGSATRPVGVYTAREACKRRKRPDGLRRFRNIHFPAHNSQLRQARASFPGSTAHPLERETERPLQPQRTKSTRAKRVGKDARARASTQRRRRVFPVHVPFAPVDLLTRTPNGPQEAGNCLLQSTLSSSLAGHTEGACSWSPPLRPRLRACVPAAPRWPS